MNRRSHDSMTRSGKRRSSAPAPSSGKPGGSKRMKSEGKSKEATVVAPTSGQGPAAHCLFCTVAIENNEDWNKLSCFDKKHPSASHEDFKREISRRTVNYFIKFCTTEGLQNNLDKKLNAIENILRGGDEGSVSSCNQCFTLVRSLYDLFEDIEKKKLLIEADAKLLLNVISDADKVPARAEKFNNHILQMEEGRRKSISGFRRTLKKIKGSFGRPFVKLDVQPKVTSRNAEEEVVELASTPHELITEEKDYHQAPSTSKENAHLPSIGVAKESQTEPGTSATPSTAKVNIFPADIKKMTAFAKSFSNNDTNPEGSVAVSSCIDEDMQIEDSEEYGVSYDGSDPTSEDHPVNNELVMDNQNQDGPQEIPVIEVHSDTEDDVLVDDEYNESVQGNGEEQQGQFPCDNAEAYNNTAPPESNNFPTSSNFNTDRAGPSYTIPTGENPFQQNTYGHSVTVPPPCVIEKLTVTQIQKKTFHKQPDGSFEQQISSHLEALRSTYRNGHMEEFPFEHSYSGPGQGYQRQYNHGYPNYHGPRNSYRDHYQDPGMYRDYPEPEPENPYDEGDYGRYAPDDNLRGAGNEFQENAYYDADRYNQGYEAGEVVEEEVPPYNMNGEYQDVVVDDAGEYQEDEQDDIRVADDHLNPDDVDDVEIHIEMVNQNQNLQMGGIPDPELIQLD